jgi:hypothetical protein
MADAIPLGTEPTAPVDVAPVVAPKKAKSPAKVLEDGFSIPEGAVQLDSHEAYRVDN